MKFTIELDTDNTLLDNLNSIEDSLRTQGIMTHTDNLVAITDNPLHDDSITLRDDVVISAVGNQISVQNPAATISITPPTNGDTASNPSLSIDPSEG